MTVSEKLRLVYGLHHHAEIFGFNWDDGSDWTWHDVACKIADEVDAENATLRQQLNDVTESMGRVEERCAKLRELVRDMMRFFEDGSYCTTCEKVAECDASEIYECDCLMHSVFADRMRELGVEVDG